jgi:tRNA U34 5-methylaminomethyl-2-thiouridine-forming methyltransferase MnmC
MQNFKKSYHYDLKLLLKKLVTTADGSTTIYVPELNEHYHSIHGAIQESEHIFIKAGFDASEADPVRIFEVGFGTGLNALLTAMRAYESSKNVIYTSIEKYILEEEIVKTLNYDSRLGESAKELFGLIHDAPWNRSTEITPWFTLFKVEEDFKIYYPEDTYDLIYFDAFGPDKQPAMWTAEIFAKIAAVTLKGGILVTYSAKGEVKRHLKSSNFEVTLLPGPPGKRQIIRAVKK